MRLTLKGLCHCSRWMNCDSHLTILVALNTLPCPMDSMILSAVLQWGWHLTEGKGQLWATVAFVFNFPIPEIEVCVVFLVNSLSSCVSYIVLDVMPVKWRWWSTSLTCGFHVNSSSLLPREITMPFVNILFLLVLPSFQFVFYSSMQRLFPLFHSPRKPFLWLSMSVLTPGVESSQEPLHNHYHAAREAVCGLCYWSPAAWPQESGKEK